MTLKEEEKEEQKETFLKFPEIKIGKILKTKINFFENNVIIGQFPEVIIKKLLLKENQILAEKGEAPLNIGDDVLCKITSIKKKYIYCLINNKFIGRMDINNYQGNLDQVKKILKETVNLRKMSVDSNISKGSNKSSGPQEIKVKIIDIIKIQNNSNSSNNDLLGISTKNKKKKAKTHRIYILIPSIQTLDENMEIEEDENKKDTTGLVKETEPLAEELNTSGKEPNIGIISAIIPSSKYPLVVKIKNNADY